MSLTGTQAETQNQKETTTTLMQGKYVLYFPQVSLVINKGGDDWGYKKHKPAIYVVNITGMEGSFHKEAGARLRD